tara:strand:- start:14273 stop:15823 length:1551 start_codon:yes stop_codon:yes gene_type:complete
MINFFRQFKIKLKVRVFLILILILPAIMAGIALQSSSKIYKSVDQIYKNYLFSIVNMTTVREQIYAEFILLKSHIISLTEKEMIEHESKISQTQIKLYLNLEEFVETLDKGEEELLLTKFNSLLIKQQVIRDKIIQLSRLNQDVQAELLINTEYKQLFKLLQENIEKIIATNTAGAQLFYESSHVNYTDIKFYIAVATIIIFIVSLLIGWLFIFTISAPILKIEQVISTIKKSYDLSNKLPEDGNDEITNLSRSINGMLLSLNEAQTRLLQAEKLASLGSLVAGISHEINTPIGIAVTMGTTFERNIDVFLGKLRANQIKRSDLDVFEKDTREGMNILLQSLDKASTLIRSFKQVAVDQTSEERRLFKLTDLIEEILLTLNHQIKQTAIEFRCDIDLNIELYSYPGPLGQVITNVLNNSIIHGFQDQAEGTIDIIAIVKDGQVELKIKDSGVGIPKSRIDKIFYPFYTTKLGQGGSGLGLNISYNIITGLLGGSISVNSEVSVGTTFYILIPLKNR